MSNKPWRGSFATPMTPFDDRDRIDEDVLRAEVRFCIESGVGGLCMPVLVSEFQLLSEAERRLTVRIAAQECTRSNTPLIACCAAVNIPLAVEYARYCEEQGADGVIAMPPYVQRPDADTVYAYYKAISDAIDIPIMVQNAGSTSLSAGEIVRLCTEIEHVSWIKEEVYPSTHSISAILAKNSPHVKGVMGGSGGMHMIHEWKRGACGVIHACQFCDLLQRVWDLLDAGRMAEAEVLFEHLLPGIVAESLMGMSYAKEIMIRRGVLGNNRVRTQARPLDEHDMREIDRIWARIEPYLTWGT